MITAPLGFGGPILMAALQLKGLLVSPSSHSYQCQGHLLLLLQTLTLPPEGN